MAEGITGWRLHVGAIFPTPVPPRAIREWYEVVPEGIDVTTVSLTIQQLTDSDMEEAVKGMERAARQLANFDVDVIYQSGVPPVVARGPGFGDQLAERLSQASGLPAITDMSSVIAAMRACGLKTLAMATPFKQFINDRLVKYLASEQIVVTNNTALGIERNVEIRRLSIPVEYTTAQDLPRIRQQARWGLHPVRRLGQHPQHRTAGTGSRHDGHHLDERHDLELNAAWQGDGADPWIWQATGLPVRPEHEAVGARYCTSKSYRAWMILEGATNGRR